VGGTNSPTGSGTGGPGRPNGSGNNPSTGLDLTGDELTVFDPGDIFDAGGVNSGQDPGTTSGRGNGASGSGGTRVPVADALPAARDAAGRALERASVPPSLQALVRAYFDNLGTGTAR
jgi:hypothetical protein